MNLKKLIVLVVIAVLIVASVVLFAKDHPFLALVSGYGAAFLAVLAWWHAIRSRDRELDEAFDARDSAECATPATVGISTVTDKPPFSVTMRMDGPAKEAAHGAYEMDDEDD